MYAMPLAAFFKEQLDELQVFMEQPDQVVRIVRVDPEMRTILLKMLIGLDEQDDFPHLLISYDNPFTNPVVWFGGMQDALDAQCATHAADLETAGISTGSSAKDPSARGPWPFLQRAEHFTDALPDSVGALVILLEPERVDDVAGFTRS